MRIGSTQDRQRGPYVAALGACAVPLTLGSAMILDLPWPPESPIVLVVGGSLLFACLVYGLWLSDRGFHLASQRWQVVAAAVVALLVLAAGNALRAERRDTRAKHAAELENIIQTEPVETPVSR